MDNYNGEVKFLSLYVEENRGWFSPMHFNGLFYVDFLTGDTKYVGKFPEGNAIAIYRSIVSDGSCLYFVPSQGDSIGVYDRTGGQISCIDIPQSILRRLDTSRFAFSIVYCSNIFMFGYNSAVVLKLDAATKILSEIDIYENSESVKSFTSTSHVITSDNKMYTIINDGKEVVEITLEDFSCRILKVPKATEKYISLAEKNGILWITGTEDDLLEYDIEKEMCKRYWIRNKLNKYDKKIEQCAWNLFICEDKLYMIAGLNHPSYIFDTLTKCFRENDKLAIQTHKKFPIGTCDIAPVYFVPIRNNDEVYFQWEADLTLRRLELKNNQLTVYPVLVDKKYYGMICMKQKMERCNLVLETEDLYSLRLFLKMI